MTVTTAPGTPTAEQDAREEAEQFAERFEATERWLDEANDASVRRIVDQVARRADGTLDLERLARLTVAAAMHVERHVNDHESNPWWDDLS
jgi:hypothetical protein